MATLERDLSNEQWDATNYAAKDNLLRVVRAEAARFFALVEVPENWHSPTAAGHWQVRDLVGHLVDTTEGYLQRFEITRSGGSAEALAGLDEMGRTADRRAQEYRNVPREELLSRLHDDFDQAMKLFEGLTEQDWGGLMVTHAYMGPLPAYFYPIGQLMDYGVHGWDVREGLDLAHFLDADAADLLVPFMFVLWQATTDASRLDGDALEVGVRVSGRNAGTLRVTCTDEGMAYEPGSIDDMPAVLDFDPASLVLTAFGRTRSGTVYGDDDAARRFAGLFFRI
ncbi:MAG: maleylpyruvate isomerase family mycothiol-dependent enzyme [Actinomycetota bacterium]